MASAGSVDLALCMPQITGFMKIPSRHQSFFEVAKGANVARSETLLETLDAFAVSRHAFLNHDVDAIGMIGEGDDGLGFGVGEADFPHHARIASVDHRYHPGAAIDPLDVAVEDRPGVSLAILRRHGEKNSFFARRIIGQAK